MASATFKNYLRFISILAASTGVVMPETLRADGSFVDTPVPEAMSSAISSLTIEDRSHVQLSVEVSSVTGEPDHFIRLEGGSLAMQVNQVGGFEGFANGDVRQIWKDGAWTIAPGSFSQRVERLSNLSGVNSSAEPSASPLFLNRELFEVVPEIP